MIMNIVLVVVLAIICPMLLVTPAAGAFVPSLPLFGGIGVAVAGRDAIDAAASAPPSGCNYCDAFSRPAPFRSRLLSTSAKAKTTVKCPTFTNGLSAAVVEAIVEEGVLGISSDDDRGDEVASSSPLSATKRFGINSRGAKMNEVNMFRS
jgi:hypothetical protein